MKITSIKYHLKQGVKNITKNGLMSAASIASVAACAFMLIISLCIAINIDKALEKVEESIGVSLYLGDTLTDDDIKYVFKQLKNIPNVTEVSYMSKEDALVWAKKEWKDEEDILSGLEEDNPFPRSFELSINGAKNQKQVIKDVNRFQKDFEQKLIKERTQELNEIQDIIENPLSEDKTQTATNTENKEQEESIPKIGDKDYEYIGIERIRHSQKEADILLAINNTIRVSSLVVLVILSIISVMIIINTIKLTVYVRKTEINIMKYVGATDWFIRWPFVIEGVIIGVIGSIIPIIISIFGYDKVVSLLYEKMPFLQNYIEFQDVLSLFMAISPATIILGVTLGVIGSVTSIKKHLNV